MNIEGLRQFIPQQTLNPNGVNKTSGSDSFGNTLSDMIKEVNSDQIESQKKVESFVAGEGVELHEVMIAGEQAKTSLALLMEIRNKAVDMFKELTRMPV